MLLKNYVDTPIGNLIVLADEEYVRGVWFDDQKYLGSHYNLDDVEVGDNKLIINVKKWIEDYFLGKNPQLDLSILGPEVTDFRKKVIDVLLLVPYGHTNSYKEISEMMSKKKLCSARAVGGAVANNPISILIPCHRVVGSDSSLTGYAGGIDRKIKLLELEKNI
ncbi:methylated-DNA--[protein]-cysteine S-methyltransferase [Streptobacillus moniliformis]|uniref:methylated-DNA--[protein]-cysteine S-methyltransferase n=1 Tax=Streptobacillus moniliformis TaxID=34105 RepID=UPI0007E45FF7|nr:methylated-DNA--[protein]-cysteine S-methyltransferase [Streptobacillus moniliformis]